MRHQGEELGPYGLASLRELGGRGRLAAYDRVWTEGMGSWVRADLIEGLLPRQSPDREAARGSDRARARAVAAKALAILAILLLAAAGLRELRSLQAAPTGRPDVRTSAPNDIHHATAAVTDENEYAHHGFRVARAELEADFLSVPVFAVLQRLEPATFTRLRETYVSGVLGGAPHDEMSARVRTAMMERIIPKYVRMAPDQELIAYWRTQIEKAQELRAIDPRYCAEFLAPRPGSDTRELAGLFSAKSQQADVQALADLMVAGAKHPQKVPQGNAIQGALRESARRAEERVPGALQIVAHPGMATARPSEFCHAEVAWYESILALPTHRAGPLLRYLVAQG